jgi:HSP20 family protein
MPEARSTQPRSGQTEDQGSLQRREGTLADRLRRRDPFDIFDVGPFSLMRRMQEDMNRIFGNIWGTRHQWPSFWGEGERSEWMPAVEAFHRGNEFVVRADVPGLTRDDLSVEIGDDALTIQGERKYDREEEREGVFTSERGYGTFRRVIPLPEGAVSESAKANFKDGVLEIVIQAPSQEVRRGRRIEIDQEAEKPKQ